MADESAGQTKKQMRIALVGIRPADQVTLKGYLRVLLHIDVELYWVSATEMPIDLFLINEEFRSAASITKLLEINHNTPALYIGRAELGDGGINQNLLTLPLRQIGVFHDWLVQNIKILAGMPRPAIDSVSAPEPIKADESATEPSVINYLASVIKTLQARKANYELLDGERVVAIIDTKRQWLWQKFNVVAPTSKWQVRPYDGELPDVSDDAIDLMTWLWRISWRHTDNLLPIVDNVTQYQIRYWIKPPLDETRRNLLHVMTVMEASPVSIIEIANRADVSVAFARKTVASLLFAGALMPNNYAKLSDVVPTTVATDTPPATQAPVAEKKPEPQQTEKLGFLARLRKKLGL